MVHILGEKSSLLNQFILEIRDTQIQKDSMRFRRNLERVGEVFAYEISKTLKSEGKSVQTPLGIAEVQVPNENILLAVILRAGLPLHQGLLNYFDKAENAFVSAYRKYGKDNKFDIQIEYLSCPSVEDKTVILIDSMLATGSSLLLAYRALLERGTPSHLHVVVPIASKDGMEYIRKNLPKKNVDIWTAAIDDELTVKSYIVPGLGDAGDLAYGSKD